MNIIIVSERGRSQRHASLTHNHVIVLALVGLLFMPILLGTVSFKIKHMIAQHEGGVDSEMVSLQQQELRLQRAEIERVRLNAENHLNVLAQRLGFLQAQVIHMNALGGRLTNMAGLDPREFNFSVQPAIGGPAEPTTEQNTVIIMASLRNLDQQIVVQSDKLQALETLLIDRQLGKAVTPSGWPVTYGWVSSRYGPRNDPFSGRLSVHKGVDIASPMGSPVLAMGDGVVTYAGEKRGYGVLVEITHGRGYVTRYAHLSKTISKVGERVSKGQEVAKVGSSGRSTGPHLHIEVYRSHARVDPGDYLRIPGRR